MKNNQSINQSVVVEACTEEVYLSKLLAGQINTNLTKPNSRERPGAFVSSRARSSAFLSGFAISLLHSPFRMSRA